MHQSMYEQKPPDYHIFEESLQPEIQRKNSKETKTMQETEENL